MSALKKEEAQLEGLNYGIKPAKDQFDWVNGVIGPHAITAKDQAKFNLLWLNYPSVEGEGITSVPLDVVSFVSENMDRTTRSALFTPPLTFMRYWEKLHENPTMIPLLASKFPEDYLATMTMQAHKAQSRLVVREGNVVRVPFSKR